MKKVLIVIVALAVGGWVFWNTRHTDRPAADVPRTAKVEKRTLDVAVEAVGEVNPGNQVTVKSEVGGRIAKIHVATGQFVHKGEPLISLDDTDLITERDAAKTEIAGTEVQLQKAQRDHDRLQNLFKSKLVSQENLDDARTTLDLARNDFEKAQKKLQAVEDKLKKIRIAASFDGTVLNVLITEGQVVSSATSVSQGTDLMTFADLNQLLIRAHINQVDVAKVQPKQQVSITVNSLPGVTFEGQVVLIAPVATVKNGIKGFSVDVLIAHSDPRVRPGMNANLRYPVAHVVGALCVPISAVFVEDKDEAVYIQKGDKNERRIVTVGETDFQYAQITTGVKENEIVLLERPKPAAK